MTIEHQDGLLSVAECRILRGIAILSIVAHNYSHWMSGAVQENEFGWAWENVLAFVDSSCTSYMDLLFNVFSFWGHYGVTVFLFLSAYGLEQKYGKGNDSCAVGGFICKHFKKLFKMMFPGLLVSFALVCWSIGVMHQYSSVEIIAMLGLVANLLPDPSSAIFPGPYWFFGLMLQLYIVYRLLVFKHTILWTLALMIVCVLIQINLSPEGGVIRWYRYNFMGSMLPFGLGVIFARWQSVPIRRILSDCRFLIAGSVFSMLLVIISSLDFWTWSITPVFVCFTVICCVKLLLRMKCIGSNIGKCLGWFGGISAALFVWHPIVRSVLIVQSIHASIGFGLYLAFSIIIAWLMTRRG